MLPQLSALKVYILEGGPELGLPSTGGVVFPMEFAG